MNLTHFRITHINSAQKGRINIIVRTTLIGTLLTNRRGWEILSIYPLTLLIIPFVLFFLRKRKVSYRIVVTMAIIYVSVILEGTYFPLDFNQMFSTSERYFNFLHITYPLDLLSPLVNLNARVINNWLLSIYYFIPFGMLIALFRDSLSFKKMLRIVLLTSLTLESSQLVFGFILYAPMGTADIYDVIMNTLGGVLGILLLKYVLSPFYTKITKGASIYEIKNH